MKGLFKLFESYYVMMGCDMKVKAEYIQYSQCSVVSVRYIILTECRLILRLK